MRIRVLIEQRAVAHPDGDRPAIASGEVVDLPNAHAKELLERQEAEPVTSKPVARAERRTKSPGETR